MRQHATVNERLASLILRDSACAERGEDLGKGRWVRLEKERRVWMSCADVAHLVFLPRGDAALTRRASRYSALRAVLVRRPRGEVVGALGAELANESLGMSIS